MFDPTLSELFSRQETPFYYYDMDLLNRTLAAAKTAAAARGFHIHYALKANFNQRVLAAIHGAGFGADCVSGNEVKKAIEIGFDPAKVVFAGVGKSDKEISYALDRDIFAFNVESVQELSVIDGLAAAAGKTARVALRINPNVDAHTHQYITTGLDENKFGIPQWELGDAIETLRQCSHVELIGIHFHIGSQITDLNVFKSLCVKVNELNGWFDERGYRLQVLNVGGGLGVDYHHPDTNNIPDFDAYFGIFADFLERRAGQEVHFELGRALVSQCSSLISRVLYVKNGIKKNFLILDAGMTELMRPALYQAYHQIERADAGFAGTDVSELHYDVVGPICESTDCFGKEVLLPVSKRGDLIAIRTVGAYGEVMASRYNLRDEVRYVYSDALA
ncbi:diaminopimelate decarboxylase [Parapedobacter lycopersici]|uniref:diaminopimelate decarboxylase n=1 Tax=Parapedobacter lycopersici TaxID=1864939 RepID=UPI00214D4A02|nr:diaminopimelate decarboxylase [Parapedobacter lycopersici]